MIMSRPQQVPNLRLRHTEELLERAADPFDTISAAAAAASQMGGKVQPWLAILTANSIRAMSAVSSNTTSTSTTTASAASGLFTSTMDAKTVPTKSVMTPVSSSQPRDTSKKELLKNCRIMWVHLDATICTEWEHRSMVLTNEGHFGAKVSTGSSPFEDTLLMPSANSSLLSGQRSMNRVTSLLQKLYGSDNQVQKKPKTIHRCILQRTAKQPGTGTSIKCHVCHSSYSRYVDYYTHLINQTCDYLKKAKDRSQIPTVLLSPRLNSGHHLDVSALRRTTSRAPIRPGAVTTPTTVTTITSTEGNSPEVIALLTPPQEERSFESGLRKRSSEEVLLLPEVRYSSLAKRRMLLNNNTENNNNPLSKDKNDKGGNNNEDVEVLKDDTSHSKADYHAEQIPTLLPIKKRFTPPIEDSKKEVEKEKEKEKERMCPHMEVAKLAPITMVEHAGDQARLASLKELLTSLLVDLLGETKLAEMGYPDEDILSILKSVLKTAKATLCESLCKDDGCKRQEDDRSTTTQLRYRLFRANLVAARSNVLSLLEICVPDTDVWFRYGWKGMSVEEILTNIQDRGIKNIGKK